MVENEDFIVINKPAGISVHKDQSDVGFLDVLAKALKLPRLFLVHRLDQMTSGLLILAKNSESNQLLSQMFERREVTKYYLALSNQKPKKKQGLIKGDMAKSRGGSWKLLKTTKNPAITQFFSFSLSNVESSDKLTSFNGLRLFVLKPKTGKTHQLRVALKSLGAPILGDERYGDKQNDAKSGQIEQQSIGLRVDRGYLHAWRLTFNYQNKVFDVYDLPKSGDYFCDSAMTRFISELGDPNTFNWPKV